MAGQKIDGIEVSNAVKEILKDAVEKLNSENVVPCLATVSYTHLTLPTILLV